MEKLNNLFQNNITKLNELNEFNESNFDTTKIEDNFNHCQSLTRKLEINSSLEIILKKIKLAKESNLKADKNYYDNFLLEIQSKLITGKIVKDEMIEDINSFITDFSDYYLNNIVQKELAELI